MNATDTSAIEIVEVRAATVRSRKKSTDHTRVPGICMNTSGSVTNTSVAPAMPSPCRSKVITAGKIMRPIITATSMSRSDTVMAVRVRRVSFGK